MFLNSASATLSLGSDWMISPGMVASYNKRAAVENLIKESNNDIRLQSIERSMDGFMPVRNAPLRV